jgi:hypothetical protein
LKENNYNFGTTKKFKESGYAPACETLAGILIRRQNNENAKQENSSS